MGHRLRVVQAVDPSIGTSKRSDFFVIVTAGLDLYTLKIHVLDVFRARVPMHLQAARVIERWRQWRPACLAIEAVFAQSALVKELRRLGVPVREIHRHKDKPTRLAGLAMRFSEGNVIFPEDAQGNRAPWLDVLEDELCAIGWERGIQLHDHDDQADPLNDCCDLLTYNLVAEEDLEPHYYGFSVDEPGTD